MKTQTITPIVPIPEGPKVRFDVFDGQVPIQEHVIVNPESRQDLHQALDEFLDRSHKNPSGSCFYVGVLS